MLPLQSVLLLQAVLANCQVRRKCHRGVTYATQMQVSNNFAVHDFDWATAAKHLLQAKQVVAAIAVTEASCYMVQVGAKQAYLHT